MTTNGSNKIPDFSENRGVNAIVFDRGGDSWGLSPENWRDSFPEIIGRSPAMEHLLQTIAKVAKSDCSALIYGESGTGKELVAQAIHRLSRRAGKSFVAINTSAIPENLLESELFGAERGAYTGANTRRAGYFESANGGTIFLDEIGDMPLILQAKLLRVLQEKQFTPLGSSQIRHADIRVIAATHVELDDAVAKGRFRHDLFYRLNVVPIHVPALRERGADIKEMLQHFLDLSNVKHAIGNPCYFANDTLELLTHYDWPGNVRELQNLVERLVVLSGGGVIRRDYLPKDVIGRLSQIEVVPPAPIKSLPAAEHDHETDDESLSVASKRMRSTLPGESSTRTPAQFGSLPHDGLDLTSFIENLENSLIMQALERTGNNKNKAAKLLGLNRTTLVERIKKRRIAPLNMPSKEL